MTIGVVTAKLAADSVSTVPPLSAARNAASSAPVPELADAAAVMPEVIDAREATDVPRLLTVTSAAVSPPGPPTDSAGPVMILPVSPVSVGKAGPLQVREDRRVRPAAGIDAAAAGHDRVAHDVARDAGRLDPRAW